MFDKILFLRILFFDGPAFLGGWEGMQKHDICSQTTKTDSSIWIAQQEACEEMVEKLFTAYKIGIAMPVYIGLLVYALILVYQTCVLTLRKPPVTNIVFQKQLTWSPTKPS